MLRFLPGNLHRSFAQDDSAYCVVSLHGKRLATSDCRYRTMARTRTGASAAFLFFAGATITREPV